MRAFVLAGVVAGALAVASPAAAKFRLSLTIGDATPAVAQPTTVVVRSGVPLDYDLELVAVAPGRRWYDVVGVVTGDSTEARAALPRNGFAVPLVRVAGNRWRGSVRFPRRGSWQLVIPNWGPVGFAVPPPLIRRVTVG